MKRPQDFQRCYRSGRSRKHRLAVLHVARAPDGVTRIGFSVSKKIGNAVVRNRVKRRLRHQAIAIVSRLPAGSRLVVRALPPAADLTGAQLGEELTSLVDRCLPQAVLEGGAG